MRTLTQVQESLALNREQTITLRNEVIPSACGLHYEKAPLKVIRGKGTYLYSDMGEEFLDCVNCVAHVGHTHPAVVEAAKQAMLQIGGVHYGVQNSVTAEYISSLKTTLPPELDTFLFVSSGSEANDLAIQLARLYTGGNDVISVERQFHGCVSITHDVSPRQYPPPAKIPDWVHVIPCPDLYKGKYRETDIKAVEKYCDDASKIIQNAVKNDTRPACFICEPMMTIPGMIVPPTQWINFVYKEIRKVGGLAIADEAQSGLGRCGTSWWSFQMHNNLVPDILTIGKPLGNGYPTAVVVTRSEIAEKLGERLSDFQCDAISSSIGLAVLRTIRLESLLNNANNVGTFLRQGLRSLAADHPNIGDVRGKGLMVGVEIVYNRESRKPAHSIAERIAYKMKEQYILIANDGPFKNILIMTPPMCFSCENAHRVIVRLDEILKKIENEGSLILPGPSFASSSHNFSIHGPLGPERSVNRPMAVGLITLGMLNADDSGNHPHQRSAESSTTNIFEIMD